MSGGQVIVTSQRDCLRGPHRLTIQKLQSLWTVLTRFGQNELRGSRGSMLKDWRKGQPRPELSAIILLLPAHVSFDPCLALECMQRHLLCSLHEHGQSSVPVGHRMAAAAQTPQRLPLPQKDWAASLPVEKPGMLATAAKPASALLATYRNFAITESHTFKKRKEKQRPGWWLDVIAFCFEMLCHIQRLLNARLAGKNWTSDECKLKGQGRWYESIPLCWGQGGSRGSQAFLPSQMQNS